MIPLFLNDLCLVKVFKPYSSSVDTYIQVSDKSEHIVDSESVKICGFVSPVFGQVEELAKKYFEIYNFSNAEYALLQIDNGIIQSKNTKKCDCAVANDKCLCLIEFKANAYSSKLSAIHKNYKKAMEQLSKTKNIIKVGLDGLGKDLFTLRKVEAYICFRKGYPRKTSTQMNCQISFAANNDGIPLSFSGSKTL